VLGYLSNPHTAGVYGIFRQFLAPLPFLSAPLTTLIYPKFVKSVIQEKRTEVKSAVHTVNRKLAWGYSVALLVIIPGLFIYTRWIGLTLKPVEWYAFGMMIPTSFVVGRFWWARPFSNAVDPSISLRFNFYATMLCLLTIYPLTSMFGIAGTSMCMLAAALLLHVNWGRTLRRFAT
jgi:O-antigen/teichoic acid export membrane protein